MNAIRIERWSCESAPIGQEQQAGKLKISLSTACLYVYPLRQVFALAKRAGFDGVEVAINPEVDIRGGLYVKRLSEEYSLPILAVHPPMFQYPGWSGLHKSVAPYLDRALHLATQMESPLLVIHMPMAVNVESGVGRDFVDKVLETRARTNGTGPLLSLENRPRFKARDGGYILTGLDELRAFADANDFPLTLDTSHLGTWGLDLFEAFHYFRGRLANVHLSDLRDVSPRVESRPVLHSYFKQHQFPGEGKLPLRGFLRLLAQEGYSGPVTLELSPTTLEAWNPRALEQRLKEAIAFVREARCQPEAFSSPAF